MKKKISLILAGAASVLLLTSCMSSGTAEDKIGTETPPVVTEEEQVITPKDGFTVEEASNEFLGTDAFLELPLVHNVTQNSFVLSNGGSGSCPDEIETVLYDAENNKIEIAYAEQAFDKPCTMDFVIRSNKITLDEDILEPDSVVFTLNGADVPSKTE